MSRYRPVLAALALALTLAVAACSGPFSVTFEPAGPPLTTAQSDRLADTTSTRSLSGTKEADAPALRETVLSDLRTRGQAGVRAADLLTIGFPESTAAVPLIVRACAVDGVDAIVVVEAFAGRTGDLTSRRLWVFDRSSGDVLHAASFR
jgi:hypothetical protein